MLGTVRQIELVGYPTEIAANPTATRLMGLPGEGVGVITYVKTPDLIRKKHLVGCLF